jgi:hypothetical protein
LSLKTKVDSLLVVYPQNQWDDFSRFGLKTGGDGFLWFGLKIGGDGFLQFCLKTTGTISPDLASKEVTSGFLV